MPEQYQVQSGDCVSSIAWQRGYFWETLWNDPANASLKQLRKDPNVLLPGDILTIRDKQLKQEDAPCEARHKYKQKGTPAKLRLQLLDGSHKPYKNIDYTINIDGDLRSGKTDGRGFIIQSIAPAARHATLKYTVEGKQHVKELNLGGVDPISENTGVQQRLKNLGHNPGPIGPDFGPQSQAALKAFQQKQGLNATGQLDDDTRNKLQQVHGC